MQKFYLHTVTYDTSGGTYPALTADESAATASRAANFSTHRQADDTIGTSQFGEAIASLAQTTQQRIPWSRFWTAPLAAQTITAGNWQASVGLQGGNSNAVPGIAVCIGAWRPSTGALVGLIYDGPATPTILGSTASTSEAVKASTTLAGSSRAVLAGDVLFFEFWLVATQTMATAYTDTFFYDGTTEGSATSCAAYVAAPADLAMEAAPAGAAGVQPMHPTRQAVQRAATRCVGRSWRKRRSGLVVPAYV